MGRAADADGRADTENSVRAGGRKEAVLHMGCVSGNLPVLCANLSDLLSRYVCIRYAGAGRTGRIQPVYDVSSAGAYPVFRGMPVPV